MKRIVGAAIVLVVFSLVWGYKNYRQTISCQQANQELMRQVRELSFRESEAFYIKEGERLRESIQLETGDGKSLAVSDRGTYLLVFISSACGACIETAAEIFQEVRDFEKRGLAVIGVSRDDQESLSEMMEGRDGPSVIAGDYDGRVHRMFNVAGAPAFVLIHEGRNVLQADGLTVDSRLAQLKIFLTQYMESEQR